MTAILYLVILYSAFGAGQLVLRERAATETESQRTVATIVLCAIVAIPSLAQLAFPALLTALQRDAGLIRQQGQWWRLVTALVVQDGGLAGLVFNLLTLALIGTTAERLWGARDTVLLFFGTGILSQFAGFAWQPRGGGNSVANFGLAAGIFALCVVRAKSPAPRILALVAAVAALRLLALHDIHGAATAIGALVAIALLVIAAWRPHAPLSSAQP
jgi:membrane associated rhomboid family serine protease